MKMKLRRRLSIVLIAVMILVNLSSASTAYASEIDVPEEEQITETTDTPDEEAADNSEQSNADNENSAENSEKADEVTDGSDEADSENAEEDTRETAEAVEPEEGQNAADGGENGTAEADSEDAIAEEPSGEEKAAEDAGAEKPAVKDANTEKSSTDEAPAGASSAKSASEEKKTTDGTTKESKTVKKSTLKAPSEDRSVDGRGGLVIQKQIQGIPEGDYTTKFRIKLWDENGDPISGYSTQEIDGVTYETDENGEFTYDMVITVSGTQGSNGVGFTVPAPCNYSVVEEECDSPLAAYTEKSADTGTTVVGQGVNTYWYTKRGRIELTAKTAYFETDYPQFTPYLEHEITLTNNGQPVSGTFPASGSVDSVEFVDGKATVSVKLGRVSDTDADKLTIYGIPSGCYAVVEMTDPIRSYFPDSSIKTVKGNIYTVFTADCYNGPYGTSYLSGDQYFYYYDSTGKVDSVKFYFKNRVDDPVYPFADTKMSFTYLEDGTKVYYFDPDGEEHEIIVGSGERVVCACFPCYSTDNIGTRYLPVDNVRMSRLFQSGFTNELGERDESDSWSGSYTKRGVACFSMEAYAMETIHKTDRKGVPVDSTFCITNNTSSNKKKYSLIHHDSYEYGGKTYSNVYEIDFDAGLKDFDSEDENTFIKPDEDGVFNLLYPRGISGSFGRADLADTDNGNLIGGYLYELECDDDHYIGQQYWQLASNTYTNYLKYENAITYDGRTYNPRGKLHTNGIDPAAFDYDKLDLGAVVDTVFTHEMEMVNGSYPYVEKQVSTTGGYSYDSDPGKKFWFDVYYEGEIVKSFSLAAGESYHLSPSNIPTISQNTLYKHRIKERGADGWLDDRSSGSYQWAHRDGEYYFANSYNLNTEQDLTVVNRRMSKELTLQKTVVDAPEDAEATTRFKVTLWDEYEDGTKAPIKNFKTTVGEETISGNEDGEFLVDIVTKGTESASKTIKVPACCHYKIEEVSCSLGAALPVSKTNEQGVMEDNVTSEWENDLINLSVSKVDVADGEELAGAHIQILDSKKNIVEEWNSEETAHVVTALFNVGEEYTLHETVAPEGYVLTSDTTFTIGSDGKVTTTGSKTTDDEGNTVLLVEDTKTSVRISKVDVADGKELEGAHIQILDSKGEIRDEWDSTKETHVTEGLKTGEEYTLKETVAPDGYAVTAETTFTIDETGKVTTTGSKTTDDEGNTVLLVNDAKTRVKVSKVDIAGGEEVEGAHIQVIDSKGNVVDEWDSTKEAHVIEGLKTGEEYTLKETVAPDGYTVTAETKFTLNEKGEVDTEKTTTTVSDGVLLVEDAMTVVWVSKVDIADGKEVEGAHIQIIDSEGKVVDEWDSTTEAHVTEGLKTGEEYTLKETVAPDGYLITSETTFTIDEEGKVTSTGTTTADEDGNTVLLVEDAKTHVEVSKVDIADGEELEGAHIQIIDSKGNVVEEWDSTTEAHVIEGLKTGEEYTLRETVAPEGYLVTSDTTFTIDETGRVKSTGSTTEDEEGNTVLLVEDTKTHIEVSKVDIATGEELEGAHIQILDSEGNVVEEWDSTKEAYVIEGLKTGVEYTLRETVAPDGYLITTDTTFVIDETGKVTSTGTVTKDEEGNTILLVEDAREGETGIMIGGEKVLQGASLKAGQFTFVLKDESGKTIGEAKNDAEGNFTFDRIAYKLADLNGEKQKVFTYTVSEVKGSETGITYDESVITVKVTVTDNGDGTMTAAADKARSEIRFVNKAEEKKSSKTGSRKKGSNTGDDAPLGILLGGFGIGVAGLAALLAVRRKRKAGE